GRRGHHSHRTARRDRVVRADAQAGAPQLSRGLALRVILGVSKARLDLGHHVARIRLRRGVLALLLLTEEARQRDRGKNADDQDDNEELDKREALLVVRAVAQAVQHWSPPRNPFFGPTASSCARAGTGLAPAYIGQNS